MWTRLKLPEIKGLLFLDFELLWSCLELSLGLCGRCLELESSLWCFCEYLSDEEYLFVEEYVSDEGYLSDKGYILGSGDPLEDLGLTNGSCLDLKNKVIQMSSEKGRVLNVWKAVCQTSQRQNKSAKKSLEIICRNYFLKIANLSLGTF